MISPQIRWYREVYTHKTLIYRETLKSPIHARMDMLGFLVNYQVAK